MHKRLGTSLAAIVAAFLLVAPSASASTEVGWACTANDSEPNWTLLAAGGSSFPISPVIPPEGPKVITGWGVWVGPGLGPIAQRLEVFEIQNEASEYKKIGESATETLVVGTNSFLTRIPVTEGDSVGLYGPAGTLLCDKNAGAISLLHEGGVASGETKFFEGAIEVGTPLRVVVEDDRDGDGYGDQSQDGCPESAVYQSDCPIVALTIGDVAVKRRAILIEVSVNATTSVEVRGEVRWQRSPKPGAAANRSRADGARVRVGLGAAGARTIEPGTVVTLRVALPKAVRKRLDRLAPPRRLRARINVKGRNLANQVGTHGLKIGLPGRARPQQPPR